MTTVKHFACRSQPVPVTDRLCAPDDRLYVCNVTVIGRPPTRLAHQEPCRQKMPTRKMDTFPVQAPSFHKRAWDRRAGDEILNVRKGEVMVEVCPARQLYWAMVMKRANGRDTILGECSGSLPIIGDSLLKPPWFSLQTARQASIGWQVRSYYMSRRRAEICVHDCVDAGGLVDQRIERVMTGKASARAARTDSRAARADESGEWTMAKTIAGIIERKREVESMSSCLDGGGWTTRNALIPVLSLAGLRVHDDWAGKGRILGVSPAVRS